MVFPYTANVLFQLDMRVCDDDGRIFYSGHPVARCDRQEFLSGSVGCAFQRECQLGRRRFILFHFHPGNGGFRHIPGSEGRIHQTGIDTRDVFRPGHLRDLRSYKSGDAQKLAAENGDCGPLLGDFYGGGGVGDNLCDRSADFLIP